jgi:hypothetical protein
MPPDVIPGQVDVLPAQWGEVFEQGRVDGLPAVLDRGWSDPVSAPQDGITVATDLHILLDRAHVPGPFVLVGHSSGA